MEAGHVAGQSTQGSLYFISAEGLPFIKVGRSKDPVRRLRQLASSSPHRLTLLQVYPEEGCIEKVVLGLLKSQHHTGEWFLLPDNLEEIVFRARKIYADLQQQMTEDCCNRNQQQAWQKPLGAALHAVRTSRRLPMHQVSQAVNMHTTDISKLERGVRPGITFEAIIKLATFYGLPLDALYTIPVSASPPDQECVC